MRPLAVSACLVLAFGALPAFAQCAADGATLDVDLGHIGEFYDVAVSGSPLVAGFLGLGVLNLFAYQPLDVLTMLGFVILVGTVVNNAILIVHQALNPIREEALSPTEAIRESTRTRVRPIFMSVSTSLCGMLPLVLFPGAGSELYRGLGSVVVGGLAVSTAFTLFLVPALFSLVLDARTAIAARLSESATSTEEPATAG